jgi:small subunit ribosomal protein S2
MAKVDVKALLEAGVHFGHRTEKWNPKMKPFIFEARNGIYVIDLGKTAEQLEAACQFLKTAVGKGAQPLFVGCKKQAQETVKEIAEKCNGFYVIERWLGGTLTNLATIRRSVGRMRQIDDLEKTGKINAMPKKEASALRRENAKLHRNLDGLANMENVPGVMIVVDPSREDIAVREAKKLNIPVVAINDTNSNPEAVDYPIPGNDDAIRSIRVILEYVGKAITEGRQEGGKKREGGTGKNNSVELSAVSA